MVSTRLTGTLILVLFLWAPGCSRLAGGLSGYRCEEGGVCVTDYTCDPDIDTCVGTADSCDSAGRKIPCEYGAEDCSAGCRTCLADLTWGGCIEEDPTTCTAGTLSCDGDALITCDASGEIDTSEACTFGCRDDVTPARCNACEPGTVTCEANGDLLRCGADGVLQSDSCAALGCSEDGGAHCNECSPGTISCAANELTTCNLAGLETVEACDAGCALAATPARCNECLPSSVSCDAVGNLITCASDGTITGTTPCGAPGCNDSFPSAVCNACVPDSSRCDGINLVTCATDGQSENSVSCATATDCQGAGACDSALLQCEILPQAPDGTPCDEDAGQDGDYCNSSCQGGACDGTADPICDDGVECTQDSCDSADGCGLAPEPAGVGCDGGDGDACNSSCDGAGACVTVAVVCDDGNGCTDDTCVAGGCPFPAVTDGLTCVDGDNCTVGETCQGGNCNSGTAPDCSGTGTFCRNDSTCDPAGVEGNCNTPGGDANESDPCDDLDPCLTGETCQTGTCTGGTSFVCSGTFCADSPSCDPGGAEGNCDTPGTPLNEGVGCDDSIICNVGETCQSGLCTGGAPPDCSSFTVPCREVPTCESTGAEGNCDTAGAATDEGNSCVDGDACTVGETCQSGDCTGGVAPDCRGTGGSCREDSTCNAAGSDGNCDTPGAAIRGGDPCNDGDSCNITEICTGGVCGGGSVVTCGSATNCAASTSCDPAGDEGNCDTPGSPQMDGTGCGDCTGPVKCDGNGCFGGVCPDCDGRPSSHPCTTGTAATDCAGCVSTCQLPACRDNEHFACADSEDSLNWGPGLPCESVVTTGCESSYDADREVGGACGADNDTITITYTINTQSPMQPFWIWMRNAADNNVSNTSEDYVCSVTGVNGGGTANFRYDKPSDSAVSDYGPDCPPVGNGAHFCWMVANTAARGTSYTPILLDQGQHVIFCTVTTNEDDEETGFDGLIITNNGNFVPSSEGGNDGCFGSDAMFTAGECTDHNWGPNLAPALDGTGFCTYRLAPLDTPCGNPSNTQCTDPDTCSANGSCRANHAGAADPCDTCSSGPCECNGSGICVPE